MAIPEIKKDDRVKKVTPETQAPQPVEQPMEQTPQTPAPQNARDFYAEKQRNGTLTDAERQTIIDSGKTQ